MKHSAGQARGRQGGRVLGLFDQAGALGAHGNAVALAPLLGGSSDHHVSTALRSNHAGA